MISMNVEDYLEWKKQGLSDKVIMKEKIFNCNSDALLKWKRENGIARYTKRFTYLGVSAEEIRELHKKMGYREIAEYYGLTYGSLYDWVRRQRRNGVCI